MTQDRWTAVDRYLSDRLIPADPVLDAVLQANEEAGLPRIDVSPPQGMLLYLLARMCGARRILEIGALGGYSTIWMARALADGGRVVTLEADPHHASIASANIARAGLESRVDLRLGIALDILPALADEAPFDLIFIDADKENLPGYLDWSLKLSRPGTVIVTDNVVREGGILAPDSDDPSDHGVRTFFDMIAENPRLQATALQTVGTKGWDGLAIAIVD